MDTVSESLSSLHLRGLKKFGQKLNTLGANFAVCDPHGELVLLCDEGTLKSDIEQLTEAGRQVLEQHEKQEPIGADIRIYYLGPSKSILAAFLRLTPETRGFVALIDSGGPSTRTSECLRQFCLAQNLDCQLLTQTVNDLTTTNKECLGEMLRLFAASFCSTVKTEQQIAMVSSELAQTYEELVLLHKLSANMKVTESDATFLQMACDSLTEIVGVEGIAILLDKVVDDERQMTLAAGSGLIDLDHDMAEIIRERLVTEVNCGKDALLDSEVDSPFKYNWPANIANIITVPLYGKDRTEARMAVNTQNGNSIIGLMVAINRIDKPDFDSTDVKLFNSVANGGCAVFIENGRLFTDIKELFIGSLKALTSSIDAKDKYTRGHSERVAFISRWIAERLSEQEPLDEEIIHKIYLAGLLHDIGKMGIDERVLRKEGKLTDEEFRHIRSHPSIGADILSGIKQMREIVPGVLYHHERADGKGYPTGIAGDNVPLVGKIVALADSFDAMTSRRTYRDAMNIEKAISEIRNGLGTQFDEKIGRIFVDSDIQHLWNIVQNGFDEVYGSNSFSEYGTAAVGTLIR